MQGLQMLNKLCDCSTSSGAAFTRPGSNRAPWLPRVGGVMQRAQNVACDSNQPGRFRREYNPSAADLPPGDRYATPFNEAPSAPPSGSFPPPDEYWKQDAGYIKVRNRYAQRARLAPAGIPQQGGFPGEEYYVVELERRYSKQWPSFAYRDGKIEYNPGFLGPLEDPELPFHFFYRGIERVGFSLTDRAAQTVATVAFAAVYVYAFSMLWQWQPQLAAAVLVSWARNTLSIGKWAALLFMAYISKLWLFWIFLGAKIIDGVLERHAPPIRKFMWVQFSMWMLYVVLSPIHCHPLPFWPFAPGSMGALENPYLGLGQ
mmetsp:Transcript_36076/g.80283  ORF Transcript_36076/g.80283 Transcript_36076/m.80283 type:complete len:316 (-) Transcript_36076:857-1804(-)|eukprot:CAMPEP_0202890218 /NCGR_PEP_ID=MMETSP1392-20130828/714_1 /ASSEMBLY_ACC=CAM_ASM_000868 /TAXON_ID=225041 /ORGANISM="Chlamydomonas chlamydogama, Strain SAG 11-48b" /LENGTH=315 /DNA_ID=CAMNT_0049573755 /DNA_START=148 /DNA_END=1095 /DNA_ORIENTATION=+